MPCRDDRDDCRSYSSVVHETALNRIKELEVLLCSACTALEDKKYKFAANPTLDEWWAKHKKEDEKREAAETKIRLRREQAKLIADTIPVSKMTAAEKMLLKEQGYL